MPKISELPDITSLTGDDILLIVNGVTGEFSRITLADWVKNMTDVIPMAMVHRSTNYTVPTSTIYKVQYDQVIYDTDSMWNAATPTVLTCKTAGKYLIRGQVAWGYNLNNARACWLNVNSTKVSFETASPTLDVTPLLVLTVYNLEVNDTVSMEVRQTSGGNLALQSYGYGQNLSVVRIG